jgi:hypothetical protein
MTPYRRAIHIGLLIGFDACVVFGGVNATTSPARAADSTAVAAAAPAAPGAAGLTLAASPSGDLGPTSDPPWNPPGAMSRRRVWEHVLTFPGRVVSLPLTGLGIMTEAALFRVEESAFIQRANYVANVIPERTGIRIAPAELGDRTGLGAKLQLSTPFLGGKWRNVIMGEISGSTRLYNSTRLRIGGNPLSLEYGYDWRPQEQFFGVGQEADNDSVSGYAAQQEYVRLGLNWRWNQREESQRERTSFQIYGGPRARIMRKGHESGRPSFEEIEPQIALPTLDTMLEYFIYGGSFSTDWRTGTPHWTRGWRFNILGEHYGDPPSWLAIRDARGRGATFTRWGAEFETGFSFMRDPRTVRIYTRFVDQIVVDGAEKFVVADLVKLGGAQGLWGFEPGRFHDFDAFLVRGSYIFPLSRRFEINLHAEGGAVYRDVWEDLSLRTWEHSWGAYLRGRSATRPVGSFGFDVSREGLRIRYSIGDVD